jgi:hypothetical protein
MSAAGRRSRFIMPSPVCGDICRSIPTADGRADSVAEREGFRKVGPLGEGAGPESSSENIVPITGDRGFESLSLQRRVCELEMRDRTGYIGPEHFSGARRNALLNLPT